MGEETVEGAQVFRQAGEVLVNLEFVEYLPCAVIDAAHYLLGAVGEAVQGEVHRALVVAEHHGHHLLVVGLVGAGAVDVGTAVDPEGSLAHKQGFVHMAGRVVVDPHLVHLACIYHLGDAEVVQHAGIVILQADAVDVGREVVPDYGDRVDIFLRGVANARFVDGFFRLEAEEPVLGVELLDYLNINGSVGIFLEVGGIFGHLLVGVVPVHYLVDALAVVRV